MRTGVRDPKPGHEDSRTAAAAVPKNKTVRRRRRLPLTQPSGLVVCAEQAKRCTDDQTAALLEGSGLLN